MIPHSMSGNKAYLTVYAGHINRYSLIWIPKSVLALASLIFRSILLIKQKKKRAVE